MADWFCNIGGQQSGPMTDDTLRRMAVAGQLQPSDLVWQEGMPDWVSASAVRGLFSPPQMAPAFAPAPGASPVGGMHPAPVNISIGGNVFGGGAMPFGPQLPKGMAVASMVLGIISLALFCVWWLALPCGVLAIILGGIAQSNAKRGLAGGQGMATAGLVMGIIAIGIALMLVATGVAILSSMRR